MKLKLLMLTILLPFNLAASSILCTGLGNQGELIELSLEFSAKKSRDIYRWQRLSCSSQ
jgi:hypothetical protein